MSENSPERQPFSEYPFNEPAPADYIPLPEPTSDDVNIVEAIDFDPATLDPNVLGVRGITNKIMQGIDGRIVNLDTLIVRPRHPFIAQREDEKTYHVHIGKILDIYSPLTYFSIIRAGYSAVRLTVGNTHAN